MILLILGTFKKPFQRWDIWWKKTNTHFRIRSNLVLETYPASWPWAGCLMPLFLSQGMLNTTPIVPQASQRHHWDGRGKPPAPGGCPGTTGSHSFGGIKRTEERVISMRENYTNCVARRKKYSKSEKWPFRMWWWESPQHRNVLPTTRKGSFWCPGLQIAREQSRNSHQEFPCWLLEMWLLLIPW